MKKFRRTRDERKKMGNKIGKKENLDQKELSPVAKNKARNEAKKIS
jgi:hypothetical protein